MKTENFGSMRIIETTKLVKGFQQKRRHSKKRINKKWRKIYGTTPIPDDHVYVMCDAIFCHPEIAKIIRRKHET